MNFNFIFALILISLVLLFSINCSEAGVESSLWGTWYFEAGIDYGDLTYELTINSDDLWIMKVNDNGAKSKYTGKITFADSTSNYGTVVFDEYDWKDNVSYQVNGNVLYLYWNMATFPFRKK